eukprot:1685231-Rhodomonas_salina.2
MYVTPVGEDAKASTELSTRRACSSMGTTLDPSARTISHPASSGLAHAPEHHVAKHQRAVQDPGPLQSIVRYCYPHHRLALNRGRPACDCRIRDHLDMRAFQPVERHRRVAILIEVIPAAVHGPEVEPGHRHLRASARGEQGRRHAKDARQRQHAQDCCHAGSVVLREPAKVCPTVVAREDAQRSPAVLQRRTVEPQRPGDVDEGRSRKQVGGVRVKRHVVVDRLPALVARPGNDRVHERGHHLRPCVLQRVEDRQG